MNAHVKPIHLAAITAASETKKPHRLDLEGPLCDLKHLSNAFVLALDHADRTSVDDEEARLAFEFLAHEIRLRAKEAHELFYSINGESAAA